MTMQRIARRSGVSIATVSRVLNGVSSVSPKSVKKVLSAMEKVGYRPRVPQRNHNPGIRTGYVGLLLINVARQLLRLPTMIDLVTGVENALAQHDFQLVLTQVPDPGKLPSMVSPTRMDGALIIGHPSPEIQPDLQRLNSVLMLGGARKPGENDWCDWITPDYEAIGRLAGNYLIARGHRNLAYINPLPCHAGLQEVGRAFMSTAEQAGIKPFMLIDGPNKDVPVWDPQKGRPVVLGLINRLLELPIAVRPSGLLVTDNEITRMIYQILKERGLKPGSDFEVISRDNDNPLLSVFQQRPATIVTDHDELARQAVNKLIYRLNNPEAITRVRVLVPPRLIPPGKEGC